MIKCPGCARRRETLRRIFIPKSKKGPDTMTEPKLKPIAPIDVEMRKERTGEIIAWDKVNNRIVSTGFDDEADFDNWKKEYFAHPSNFAKE